VAYIKEFGSYVPAQVISNEEIGAKVGCDAAWIVNVSGIEERRFANESVAELGWHAARECLDRSGMAAEELAMILVASSSAERRIPGPAVTIAKMLGLERTPAIDLPIASAGTLFGMSLASRLADSYGAPVLVVGTEKMSSIILRPPMERGVAILFGDGAGACLVHPSEGKARIIDSIIETDGAFAEDLRLDFDRPIEMNGRSVILQASRKIPRAITEVLTKHCCKAQDVGCFLMHQANQNLIAKVARSLGVSEGKFFSNIRKYGNTSSASMLIAATEWSETEGFRRGIPICFAAFGAGFHWGALLAEGV
jgi:3-oxoacyl-[acyl-carrier-protein] synthase-3